MEGFNTSALVNALRLALLADGKSVEPEVIALALTDALIENEAQIDGVDFLPVTVMFLIFADFSDNLGRALGYEVTPDGFALDWAVDCPQFCKACAQIRSIVVSVMRDASKLFQQAHGFSPEDVFMRMVEDDIAPEVAASMLDRERNHITIH